VDNGPFELGGVQLSETRPEQLFGNDRSCDGEIMTPRIDYRHGLSLLVCRTRDVLGKENDGFG
jgi:hypothetical protein